MKDLPIYKIFIDENDDSGIEFVSLVDKPAILLKGLTFSANDVQIKKDFTFKYDEEKQIIAGPAIIPDLKIYRRDEELGEYYVVFEKDVIEKMVEKFNKNAKTFQINLDHSEQIAPAFIKGSWIIENSEYDKSNMYGFSELPIGTWFIEVKVTDTAFWSKEIKDKGKFGFSIEGLMGLKMSAMKEVSEFADMTVFTGTDNISIGNPALTNIDESYISLNKEVSSEDEIINKQTNMKKEIKKFKFSEYTLADGSKISIDGDLAVGSGVFIVLEDGSLEQASEGDYTLEDNTVITVDADGFISNIVASAEVAPEEMSTPEVASAEPVVMQVSSEEVLAIVNPMLDEMRAIIAELQSRVETLENYAVKEDDSEDVVLNKQDEFNSKLITLRKIFSEQ